MYLLAICYLLSYACYLKLATSCKYLIPFAPVVRLALVFYFTPKQPKELGFLILPFMDLLKTRASRTTGAKGNKFLQEVASFR